MLSGMKRSLLVAFVILLILMFVAPVLLLGA